MSIESVMPSNHLILYHPLSLPPSVFPSIKKQPYSDKKKKKLKPVNLGKKKTHSQILNKFILAHFSSSFKNNFQRYQKGRIIQLAFVVSPPSAMPRVVLRWLTRGGVGEWSQDSMCAQAPCRAFWILLEPFPILKVNQWGVWAGIRHVPVDLQLYLYDDVFNN